MKIGPNKGKIIAVSLLRFIIVMLFLVGIYASSRDNPNFNNGAFVVMAIFGFAFAASPLRHLNKVLVLYPNTIVLERQEIKKQEIYFSTPEEIKWSYVRGYLIGQRLKCCKETKSTGWKELFFPYNEISRNNIRWYNSILPGKILA